MTPLIFSSMYVPVTEDPLTNFNISANKIDVCAKINISEMYLRQSRFIYV